MKGNETFKVAVKAMADVTAGAADGAGLHARAGRPLHSAPGQPEDHRRRGREAEDRSRRGSTRTSTATGTPRPPRSRSPSTSASGTGGSRPGDLVLMTAFGAGSSGVGAVAGDGEPRKSRVAGEKFLDCASTADPMTLALLFPGQGSQFVGMGKALCEASAAARARLRRGGRGPRLPDLEALLRGARGRAEAHRQHAARDPDALDRRARGPPRPVSGAARGRRVRGRPFAGRVLGRRRGGRPRLRRRRAARARARPLHAGGRPGRESARWRRSSVSPPAEVEAACAEAAQGEVVAPANFNSPEQTVIAGHAAAVERAVGGLPRAGRETRDPAARLGAVPLRADVAGAGDGCARSSRRPRFPTPRLPVVTNVDAEPAREADALRSALVRQMDSPVRWVESVQRLAARGRRPRSRDRAGQRPRGPRPPDRQGDQGRGLRGVRRGVAALLAVAVSVRLRDDGSLHRGEARRGRGVGRGALPLPDGRRGEAPRDGPDVRAQRRGRIRIRVGHQDRGPHRGHGAACGRDASTSRSAGT